MAGTTYMFEKSFKAEAAVTKNRFVVFGTNDGEVNMPGAAGADGIVGVALESRTAGQQVGVAMSPEIAEVAASAAIAHGAKVSIAGTSGKARTAQLNDIIAGVAMKAASADGVIFPVKLCSQPGPVAA